MARVHLRLTDREFFSLTPRQFHILLDRHHERSHHHEWLAGMIASTVANFSMGAPKEPFKPGDFMPSEAKGSPIVRRRRITKGLRAEVADSVRAFFGPLAI
jgi:hypothetical protein